MRKIRPASTISCLSGSTPFPKFRWSGETEEALAAKGQAYEVGIARYYELARGQIINDHDGMLKLIFNPETKRMLGVHIVGGEEQPN